jgi:hypothetical protein
MVASRSAKPDASARAGADEERRRAEPAIRAPAGTGGLVEEHPQDLAPDDEIAPLFTRKIARDGGGIGAAEIRDRVGPISWPM